MKKDEFDQAFEKYLKERFKPFRDKERPADYGRDLSPNKEKTHFAEAFSIAPSPSGDLIAAMTINQKDREIDIVLVSAKDGSVVRNLTNGFDKDMGFDHIVQYGEQFQMPWMAWSPKGDRLAYFVRTEKERDADHPERPQQEHRGADPDEVGGRARVAEFLAGRPVDRVRGAARRRRRHLPGRPGDQADHESHHRRLRRLRADLFAGRHVHRLQRARQRQPEAVPPGSGHEEEDAADLRHGRRDGGAIRRRPYDRVLVDGDRPEPAARSGSGQERQHLQHLDARPEQRRAAAVHRRARRQLVGGGAQRRQDEPDRLRHLLQGRIPDAHARAHRAAAHGVNVGLRRPRPDHRLPGAAPAHPGGLEDQEEGQVREDVPGGAAAGERRRDEQRRHLRRHADHVRRRARRSAVQRSPPPRSPSTAPSRSPTSTWRGDSSSPCRAIRRRSSSTDSWAACSTIRRSPRSSAAATRSRPGRSVAARRSASTRSAAIAASS